MFTEPIAPRDMRQRLLNTPTYNVLKSIEVLRETIACGITTARDMGGADARGSAKRSRKD